MALTRSMTAVRRNRKAAPAKSKRRKAAAQLKRKKAACSSEELKRMAAEAAVDVDKILRIKKDAMETIETCFPSTVEARLAAVAAGETWPEKVPEKKKKVVKYLVSQSYIDHMVNSGLFRCVDEIPEDKLAKESQLFRDGYRAHVLLAKKLRACQQVLLDQYNAFGYAYDAKEVTDDEGDGLTN